jgi:hypothetical protein
MRPYRVYRNLTKKNYSILGKVEGNWRKIDEADSLELKDCALLVYESGRDRVVREGRKNVHAYVCCTSYTKGGNYKELTGLRQMTYNPYKGSEFVYANTKNRKRIPATVYHHTIILDEGVMLTNEFCKNVLPYRYGCL